MDGTVGVGDLELLGHMPAGEGVEGEGNVAAGDFGGHAAGEGGDGVARVAPVVGGAQGGEEFLIAGAFEGVAVDVEAEEIFPLGGGGGHGVMAGVVVDIGLEGDAEVSEVGGAGGLGFKVLGAGEGEDADGQEGGADGDGDDEFGEGEGAGGAQGRRGQIVVEVGAVVLLHTFNELTKSACRSRSGGARWGFACILDFITSSSGLTSSRRAGAASISAMRLRRRQGGVWRGWNRESSALGRRKAGFFNFSVVGEDWRWL